MPENSEIKTSSDATNKSLPIKSSTSRGQFLLNHIRRKSSMEGINPLDDPEIYYGPATDPSRIKPNYQSTAGRTRTMSAILPKTRYSFDRPNMTPSSSTNGKNQLNSITSESPSPSPPTEINNNYIKKLGTVGGSSNNSSSSVVFNIGGNGKNKKGKNLADEVRKRLNKDKQSQNRSINAHTSPFDSSDEDDDDDSDNESAFSQDSEFSSNGFKFRNPKNLSTSSVDNTKHNITYEESTDPISGSNSQIATPIPMSPSHSTSSLVQLLDSKVANSKDNSEEKIMGVPLSRTNTDSETTSILGRRLSIDTTSAGGFYSGERRFFINNINETLEELLAREDTDSNCQITIEDTGPKVLKVGTANSNGYNQYAIRGTYMLSNLLQELTIAQRLGRNQMILDEERLNENPVHRLTRLIKTQFWKKLKRQITESTIAEIATDTKIHTPEAKYPRIYIPYNETKQFEFYTNISKRHPEINLQVEYLPKDITPEFVRSINHKPGLLALAMREIKDPKTNEITLIGHPYIVPGGRFNEQYGWDSYMETLGLLLSKGQIESCIGMCENFIFEIEHYGKILNANRSYYLCRSQPPFLTDMAIKIYDYLISNPKEAEWCDREDFLKRSIIAAIKEYETVWCCKPRLDEKTGLSCYHPDGLGIPPETESTHFQSILEPYVKKYNTTFENFQKLYNEDKINEPKLDEYFLHDRAVRESGHDTSYRLEGKCANLATVDLNSLLYKYEIDISEIIKTKYNNELKIKDKIYTSEYWIQKSEDRKLKINKYLWNETKGMYFDYDIKLEKQITYESVTTFWPMWSKICSKNQAERLIKENLSKFEKFGGLVAGTEESRGKIGLNRPARQWDYPYGWAPHQIICWQGLKNYGYENISRRLIYRWLYLMTLAFVDFNGIVVEKYDVTSSINPHKVDAEYGNQGSGFKGVALEGFGWVNASYLIGLNEIGIVGQRGLGMVTPPDHFFKFMNKNVKELYGLT